MTVTLDSKAARLALVLACTLLLGWLTWSSSRALLADHYTQSNERGQMEAAIKLEPRNAEYFARLGRLCFFAYQDMECAEANFKSAIRLDENNSRYLLDLASVYQVDGDYARQQQIVQRAVEVDPNTPDVAWEAASYLTASGETRAALQQLRTVIAGDPMRSAQALAMAYRLSGSAADVLDRAVPTDSAHLLAALKLFASKGDLEGARLAWQKLSAERPQITVADASPYVELLMQAHDPAGARAAWLFAAQSSSEPSDYIPTSDDLVVNGGFEANLVGSGLGWRLTPPRNVQIAADVSVSHSGNRALQLSLDSQASDIGLAQLIPVDANTTYEFTAFMKGEKLVTANGPRFELADAYTDKLLLRTDDLTDSGGWRQVRGSFNSGAATLLRLRLTRESDSGIKGTIWIDDVSLSPLK
jgi:tetratricopeptide (TPR) repeat protein